MNCDEAFDCLTDPARRDSDALKWHLDLCARCRQMRDVLSPAIDLFDDDPPPSAGEFFDADPESRESRRSITLSPEALQIAERTAAELSAEGTRRQAARRARAGRFVRYAAVFLLGAMVMFAAAGWPNLHRRADGSLPAGDGATACLWSQEKPAADSRPASSSRDVVLRCVACHLRNRAE